MEMLDLNRFIIVIDKPKEYTSFQVTDFVRKQLNLNKAAHSGTLDPEVTGVLPILLGRASRLLDYFIHQDKKYVGIMHMHKELEREKIEHVIKNKFIGKIKQLPPVKSRVKREEREREIKKFEILEQNGKDFLFVVECEAGTYIRKLVHDLGNELGIGAHMTELRRTNASIFEEKDAVNLYDFVNAVNEYKKGDSQSLKKMLVPVEIITKILPKIEVKAEAIEKLKHGSPLFNEFLVHDLTFKDGKIALFAEDRLIGVYSVKKEGNISAKPEFVMN